MAKDWKSLWKEITGLFSNSETDTENAEAGMNELRKYLEQTEEGALPEKPDLPATPVYDRLAYDAPDDGQIRQTAEDGLREYRESALRAVEDETTALREKYEKDKQTAEANRSASEENLHAAYEQADRNLDDDLLKRGLARSSIAANKKARLNASLAEGLERAYRQYAQTIAGIDGEIGDLEVKRVKALNDFNVTYAARLTQRINELRTERDAKQKEALEYNNSLTEKEIRQAWEKREKESELYSDALSQREKENDLKEENSKNYASIYEKMCATLSGMSREKAREAVLNDPLFKNNLNGYYYYKLYDAFVRR